MNESGCFPFNRHDYAQLHGLDVVQPPRAASGVLLRAIPGTDHMDGLLPLPYVALQAEEIDDLAASLPELISLTATLRPSDTPPARTGEHRSITPLKPHFVFDPGLPRNPLSRKSRANLHKGSRLWTPADTSRSEDWDALDTLYRALVGRRGLSGSLFDYPAGHFRALSGLPGARLFGVRDAVDWGAMACGLRYGDELHLLHVVTSSRGLASNASYVLMQALLDECAANGTRLYLGGVPRTDTGGMLRFKLRWSNRQQTSWLLGLVIQPRIYRELAIPGNDFFPAYRRSM